MAQRQAGGPTDNVPTMIIPPGTDVEVDGHGQLSIRTPGNLVIQDSGHYGTIESRNGSIRIDSGAEVEAVDVRCAETCYIEGSLTAWKVAARAIQLEENARASIVLQETEELQIGRQARLVGNFTSEKELFLLFSRFARQLRALPLFSEQKRAEELGDGEGPDLLLEATGAAEARPRALETPPSELPDPLFFALVLLEREFTMSAYGPTSKRAIEELIKLLQVRDLETLRMTYQTLFNRVVEPGRDVDRAHELIRDFAKQPQQA
jgi:hypothetical protein